MDGGGKDRRPFPGDPWQALEIDFAQSWKVLYPHVASITPITTA